jgi:hypothetical protein
MLSSHEQRAWDEIRAHYAEAADEPAPPDRDPAVLPPRTPGPLSLAATVLAGGCVAALLVLIGAPVAGLAIAVATVPRWLLWRYWSSLDGVVVPPAPALRDVPLDGSGHPASAEHRRDSPRAA